MIRQDQNNTGSQVGQYGLNPNAYRTNPTGRSTEFDAATGALIVAGLTTALGQGGSRSGNQTTTQQNLPDWAIPYAQNTMNIGSQFTMNPNYRPSTLDRDYSGIRGYNAQGQLADPINNSNTQRQFNQSPNLDNLVAQLPPDMQGGGPLLRAPIQVSNDSQRFKQPQNRAEMFEMARTNPDYAKNMDLDQMFGKEADQIRQNLGLSSRGGGRQNSKVLEEQTQLLENPVAATPPSGNPVFIGYGRDYDPTKIYTDLELNALAQSPSGEFNSSVYQQLVNSQTALKNAQQAASSQGTEEAEDGEEEPVPFSEMLTPFSAYDRQRFAGPSEGTVRGEGILSGRYDQRFGAGGTDPFTAATTAVNKAAGYGSTYKGLMDSENTLAQSGEYQTGLGTATDPNIFKSGVYTTDLNEYTNPNKDLTNVNKELLSSDYTSANKDLTATEYGNAASEIGNVNANVRSNQYGNANQGMRANQYGNVNQGIQAAQYGNASQGLQGPQNYNRNYQDLVQQSFNPFQDQVVNQTIKDLDRARQITNNEISGSAAKAGAFGGSREALMRAENNRNFYDRVGSAVGQLRSQGFESAANRANQENLQRLGLTASDVQNFRGIQNQGSLQGQSLTAEAERQRQALMSQGGLQGQNLTAASQQQLQGLLSQGNLQGQNLSAASDQQANALRSQGALAAQEIKGRGALQGQNLTASDQQQLNSLLSQGNLQGQSLSASDLNNVRNLISQGGLAVQGLESQGALAALGANADLYSRALGFNSASDLAALQANAGLLSDAMGLDAADLQQRRNLASTEAQFAETANRGAGALNLQGGTALGQLAQAGTADERQRIADLLAAGAGQDNRNQQDLDFIYNEFQRELGYPMDMINLRNAAISPATNSVVTTSSPLYGQNPLLQGLGAGLSTYSLLKD